MKAGNTGLVTVLAGQMPADYQTIASAIISLANNPNTVLTFARTTGATDFTRQMAAVAFASVARQDAENARLMIPSLAQAQQLNEDQIQELRDIVAWRLMGNMIITSGQIPVNPKTGEVPADVAAQARQSLDNVKAIVEAAGLKVGDIVKTTVFVKDLNDFATVNATYEAFFTEHNATFPARSCVEVARLPKDVKIEIEAIAVRR